MIASPYQGAKGGPSVGRKRSKGDGGTEKGKYANAAKGRDVRHKKLKCGYGNRRRSKG